MIGKLFMRLHSNLHQTIVLLKHYKMILIYIKMICQMLILFNNPNQFRSPNLKKKSPNLSQKSSSHLQKSLETSKLDALKRTWLKEKNKKAKIKLRGCCRIMLTKNKKNNIYMTSIQSPKKWLQYYKDCILIFNIKMFLLRKSLNKYFKHLDNSVQNLLFHLYQFDIKQCYAVIHQMGLYRTFFCIMGNLVINLFFYNLQYLKNTYFFMHLIINLLLYF